MRHLALPWQISSLTFFVLCWSIVLDLNLISNLSLSTASLCRWEIKLGTRLASDCNRWPREGLEQTMGAFHLFGKTGRSGGKSNGTGLSTGNFSEKKEYLQRYSSFPTGTTGFSKQMEMVYVVPGLSYALRFVLTLRCNKMRIYFKMCPANE